MFASASYIGPGWTVGSHRPETINASPRPGHRGIVAPIAARGSSPLARNWNAVPSGIVMQTPVDTGTTSLWSPDFRHISPLPDRKYQISSTVRCWIATDVCPASNSKWARPPHRTCRRTRTSDPSGATSSRSGGNGFVWNPRSTLLRNVAGRLVDRGLTCSFAATPKSRVRVPAELPAARGATSMADRSRKCGGRGSLSAQKLGVKP